MKNVISTFLCFLMICSFVTVPVIAAEPEDVLVKRTVEVLDNGDTVTTEIYECAIQPRSGKTGYATTTYKNSDGTSIWSVSVKGSFTYNGSTSSATSAEATVTIYSNTAIFVSKNAYTSGNTATATGTVKYKLVQTTRSASVSCDKNGNLY